MTQTTQHVSTELDIAQLIDMRLNGDDTPLVLWWDGNIPEPEWTTADELYRAIYSGRINVTAFAEYGHVVTFDDYLDLIMQGTLCNV